MQLFIFEVVSVEEVHKALRNLEKVTVRFKRCEFNVELEAALSWDFLLGGRDVERILHIFTRSAVKHF